MTAIERPRWLLTVGGVAMRVGHVSLTMELGPLQTTVADVTITSKIATSPAERTAVTLRYTDLDTGAIWPVFAGYVLKPLAVSDAGVSIRCEGPLSLLRDTWDADTDFTGDSGGDVNKTAMTLSGIAYADADVQDDDLSLGAVVPIKGTKRTARSGLVREVNRVLGMALVEIGGSPARFAYDLVPDADDVVRTFARGASTDFFGNERTPEQGMDEIRDYFVVNGPTYDCGADDECRCTPTASAFGSNVILGSGVRTEPVPDRSDVVQSLALAEAVVERDMRWYNRPGDHLTIKTAFHPETTVGQTVGVKDAWPGVALITTKPYVVARIEVNDHDAVLQVTGGPAGDEGTIASKVEKRCNKTTSTGTGGGGSHVPPTPTVPPVVPPTTVPPIDTADPFLGCAEEASLACPEPAPGEDPFGGTCQEAAVAADDCVVFGGSIPDDVCRDAGWHHDEWTATDNPEFPSWVCTCRVQTNLVHQGLTQTTAFLADADGKVQRVGSCAFPDSGETGSVDFYVGNDVLFHETIGDSSEIPEKAKHYGGTVCVDFDYRFCAPGQQIQLHVRGKQADGTGVGPDHVFILYAEPGEIDGSYGGPGTQRLNSHVVHTDAGISSGDAAPHTSLGSFNMNNGGNSIGGGLPVGEDLHASVCFQMEGEDPPAYWDNGIDAGYLKHLVYLETEEPEDPVFNPASHVEESADHAYHVVEFILAGHGDCTDPDCVGTQVGGIVTGSETCAANEFFIPADWGAP